MSLRNQAKKFGKRKAGTWGRINHKRDMRAASKALRKWFKHKLTRNLHRLTPIDTQLTLIYTYTHRNT